MAVDAQRMESRRLATGRRSANVTERKGESMEMIDGEEDSNDTLTGGRGKSGEQPWPEAYRLHG
jgi:hypothetical protein